MLFWAPFLREKDNLSTKDQVADPFHCIDNFSMQQSLSFCMKYITVVSYLLRAAAVGSCFAAVACPFLPPPPPPPLFSCLLASRWRMNFLAVRGEVQFRGVRVIESAGSQL